MKIVFATGNPGKVKSLERVMAPLGLQIEVMDIDLIEPQLDDVREIAISKARQAYEILKRPVIVQDSGFEIKALKGFPGPYVKHVTDKIGCEGYLNLMLGKTDRSCNFISVVAFADENGEIHTFIQNGPTGRLAETMDSSPLKQKAWSALSKIFILDGYQTPMNSMTETEVHDWHTNGRGRESFTNLVQWLENRYIKTKWQTQPKHVFNRPKGAFK